MGLRDIIVLAVIGVSLPFCFFRPFFGVVVWTMVSIINPQELVYGFAMHMPFAQYVAVPTLAGIAIFGNPMSTFKGREVFLVIGLWAWFVITSINAAHTPQFADHVADTWYRLQFVSKILLMTVLSIGMVDTWQRLRYYMLGIAASLGLYIAAAVPWMILTGGQYRLYGPEFTMLADNNDFGLALNMTLPFLFFLARTEPNTIIKRVLAFLFVAGIPAVFFTYSRGALMGLALVLFLMFVRLKQRWLLAPVMMIAVAIAVFFTPEQWRERMDFRRDGALIDKSAESRFNSWTYAWNLALDYPLMGGGFDAFTPALFDRYAPNPRDVHGPHSIYFGVLAEHGFTGLFLYLSLVGSCLMTTAKIKKAATLNDDEEVASYASICQFSLLAFLISGAFLGRAYFDYFFLLVSCTAILGRLWNAEEQAMLFDEPVAAEAWA